MTKDFTEANYVISFINGQPGLVVRAEEPAEIEERIKAILPYFKKFREAVEKGSVKKAEASGLTAKCEIHNATMKEYTSKRTGEPYMGHYIPDKGMCFGKKE